MRKTTQRALLLKSRRYRNEEAIRVLVQYNDMDLPYYGAPLEVKGKTPISPFVWVRKEFSSLMKI